MTAAKPKRVRDPVHNLIEFGAARERQQLELTLWEVIQTRPFQRLRRIKQLGFSELVFPGATHTRFSHSIGVFHTARLLLGAIERCMGIAGSIYGAEQAKFALAAALVHDVGHGMFSHAFEAVGKELKLPLARHETVSDRLIREGEIKEVLDDRLGNGFAGNVADLISREQPKDLYDAVVTSQFDADRLDYMQRDRMMTGVHSGAVDVTWLLNNLEVASIPVSVDDVSFRKVETLVLGPKAYHVAESYVLALFHLYPNVYFHKATRGAELVLRDLILRLFMLHREGRVAASTLPHNHPLVRFVEEPNNLDRAQALDDTVLWGALPMLVESTDNQISTRARQLLDRRLLSTFDVWEEASKLLAPVGREEPKMRTARIARINLTCDRVLARKDEVPSAMFDDYKRDPYKRFQDSRTAPNQIHIMQAAQPRDMAELSSVVGSAEPFRICRAYVARGDTATVNMLGNIVGTSIPGDTKVVNNLNQTLEPHLVAARLVDEAGGQLVGRTRLQKVACLATLAGFLDAFQFEYRHYGPFSDTLAGAMEIASGLQFVEEKEEKAEWGGWYSIYRKTAKTPPGTDSDRRRFISRAADIGPILLELAATAAFLNVTEGFEGASAWEETARRKPEKAEGGRLEAAQRAYRQLLDLPMPRSLPAIA